MLAYDEGTGGMGIPYAEAFDAPAQRFKEAPLAFQALGEGEGDDSGKARGLDGLAPVAIPGLRKVQEESIRIGRSLTDDEFVRVVRSMK